MGGHWKVLSRAVICSDCQRPLRLPREESTVGAQGGQGGVLDQVHPEAQGQTLSVRNLLGRGSQKMTVEMQGSGTGKGKDR